ncbi:MAG TPA: TonB-dependent receptor plug domain-containing protein [Polyangiaceae bacterium]|nr:TonB-dependent receptor plug domain-containing protein [Polyangiaceae bacterium]
MISFSPRRNLRYFAAAAAVSLAAPGRADSAPPSKVSDDKSADDKLVDRVLDMRGLSQLSLEQLLDLPVVTASGKAEERSLAAANVFIVTHDDIERHGYRSLGEILRRVPGMYLIYDYVNYSVGVREVTGGYRGSTRIVKIMINGFPISFRPDLEAFLGPEFIPVEAIERVEIAKGPLSALYGANAFLATVNVITREPEDRKVDVGARYTVVSGKPGGGVSILATYGGIDTSVLLSATMDSIDRSGIQAGPTYRYQSRDNPALLRPTKDDTASPVSAYGRFDYHHDKAGDFRLEAGHQELDSKAEFLLNSVVTHRSRINLVNQWAALHWSRKVNELHLRAFVGGSHGEPKPEYQLFTTGNVNQSYRPNFGYDALNALAEASYDFGPPLQVDVGADLELGKEAVLFYTETFYKDSQHTAFDQLDLITANAQRSHGFRQMGSYLQLHSAPIRSLPNLRLTGAARADWIDFGPVTYPAQTSFRGAIAHRFGPVLTAKLIGGRAYQTPSGTLLFAHGGFGNSENVVGTERLDNPEPLRPQVVTSVEFVATTQIGDFLVFEGSVFYQDLEDAIRFNQAGQLIVAKNSGSSVTAGGELVAKLQLGRFRPYAAISASQQVSAELTRDLRGITSFSGSPSMYPRLFGYGGCDLEILKSVLFGNVELAAAGPRGASQANFYQNDSQVYSLPAYYTIDMTLSTGQLPLLDRDLGTRFSVSGRNLLGARQIEPGFSGVDIPQPGRTLLLQVRQTL